jgi:hypothetical protein
LFEAYVLALAKAMPIANAAKRLGEHDTRLWRIVEHYVWRAVEALDLSEVRLIAADEAGYDRFASTPAVRGAGASRSDCIHRNTTGRAVGSSRKTGRALRRLRRLRAAARNAVGAGGGRRAQGDDERAHRNFRLRHFSVLGGLAPRLSSAAAICNKSVSYKIGLTQDGPAISHRLDQVRRIGEQDDQTHSSVAGGVRPVRHASRGRRRRV